MTTKRFVAKNGVDNNSQTIINVADPINAQDVATKNSASNASNLTAGTMPAERLPSLTGDISSPAGSNTLTLANVGNTGTGTFQKVTVDSKGRVTGTADVTAADIPSLDAAKITTGTLSIDTSGNAATATKLETARTITLAGDVSGSTTFDGSGNVNITATVADDSHNHTISIGDGTTSKITLASNERLDLVAGSNVSLIYDDITNAVTIATTGTLSGNASSATKLETARSIEMTGDGTWSIPSFDGTANVTGVLTLANSGITAGTYTKVTFDVKGRATSGTTLAASDIPALDWSKITTGKPTTLAGYGITDAQVIDADLTAIAALTGVSGFLKTDGIGTWSVDTNTYLTAHPTITGATSVNNSGVTYIQDLTFDANGHVTAQVSADIRTATTAQTGIVQLSDSTSTTSSVLAATPTAVKTAYDLANAAIPATQKGVANGVATLDATGLVPSTQLPSYVDDVLEYANLAAFPATGETGKIYVAIDTNKTYRWSGSAYIYITSGAVDSVAGKTGVVTLTNADVGLANVENKSSATIRGEITTSDVTTALGYTPVVSNAEITASTGTKVTYDAKGLVTSSTTLDAADIPVLDASKITTGTLTLDTSGNASTASQLSMTNGNVVSSTFVTSSTIANQVVDNTTTSFRTVKFLVQATSGTAYHATEILVIHDGATAYVSEYGTVATGAELATFDADVSGGNIRLLVTPVNAATTFKIVKSAINA